MNWRKSAFFPGLLLLTMIAFNNSACLLAENLETPDDKLLRVQITRVVDGDTARALLPDGTEERVRFIGVDAPEINHPEKGVEYYGAEAEAFARDVLENRQVWLEFDLNDRDQYGRLLAYIWLSVPEEFDDQSVRSHMFNAWLLLEGYAVQVTFPPNVKYKELFSVYESEAKSKNKGLWKEHLENEEDKY